MPCDLNAKGTVFLYKNADAKASAADYAKPSVCQYVRCRPDVSLESLQLKVIIKEYHFSVHNFHLEKR